MSQKLAFKWLGLYKIYHAVEKKKIYMFEELDKLPLVDIFASDYLKKFHTQQQLRFNFISNLDHKVVPNLEDFLIANDGNLTNVPNNFVDN